MKYIRNIKTVYVIVVFFTFVLGYLGIGQVVATKEGRNITNKDNVMRLSYEIAENSNSIFDLQSEVNRLREKNDGFSFNLKDRNSIRKDLEERIGSYSELNGQSEVSGGGVEILVDGNIITEEIIDLINGIRNTKPVAMGINGDRVIYRSYFVIDDNRLDFDNNIYNIPFTIQVIGDIDVLNNSLTRAGGVLDVIKQNSFGKINFIVTTRDSIVLPAYSDKIYYRSAKNTNN